MSDQAHIALMEAVARHFFGEPNAEKSSKGELRFGTHGSKSVDLKKGVYFDHEAGEGGGPIKLIMRETGLTTKREAYKWAEEHGFWVNGKADPTGRKIVATHDYPDEGGKLLFQKVRYEPKDFACRRPVGNGGWTWKLGDIRRVLYRLPEVIETIANGHLILVVEGEKDVDNCWRIGVPATCNEGGANKWRDDLTPVFAGADVVIIGDNDEPGRSHVKDVASRLSSVASRVRVLDLANVWPQCPPKGDISNWIEETKGTAEQLYALIQNLPHWPEIDDPPEPPPPKPSGWSFHSNTEPEATPELIKGLLPQTGAGLVSGQWGVYKTTVALDIGVSVMSDELHAGRFRVKRPGGVAYFAVEGHRGIGSRLSAIAQNRGFHDPLPFAFRADCPRLLDPDAATKLEAMIKEAADELKKRFGVELVLVYIDTIIATAGYTKPGDENDAALGQKVMETLATLSRKTGALVLGVDHFGKDIETGTRGTSAKESHADVVLALIAKREISGAISNTRLGIRKQREGEAGLELPFNPKIVEVGRDEDGDPITKVIIEWPQARANATGTAEKPKGEAKWRTKNLRLLRQAMATVLVEHGKRIKPWPDGPTVLAVDIEIVRQQYYKSHPAPEGADAKARQKTREKGFKRAIDDAKDVKYNLIGSWEIENVVYIWFVDPAQERPSPAANQQPFDGEPPAFDEPPSPADDRPEPKPQSHYHFVGDCPQHWTCAKCGQDGKGEKGPLQKFAPNSPGAKADPLHRACAEAWFESEPL